MEISNDYKKKKTLLFMGVTCYCHKMAEQKIDLKQFENQRGK